MAQYSLYTHIWAKILDLEIEMPGGKKVEPTHIQTLASVVIFFSPQQGHKCMWFVYSNFCSSEFSALLFEWGSSPRGCCVTLCSTPATLPPFTAPTPVGLREVSFIEASGVRDGQQPLSGAGRFGCRGLGLLSKPWQNLSANFSRTLRVARLESVSRSPRALAGAREP